MNYRLIVEYDGRQFHGWQIQPGKRTVQAELTRAVEIIFRTKITLYAAGRTDAGVHALHQVVSFNAFEATAPEKLMRQLNGILPSDVAIQGVDLVPDSFHARYSAISREYEYVISEGKTALNYRRCWVVTLPRPMIELNSHLETLIGLHSFRSFCPQATTMPHYNCLVEAIYWEQQNRTHRFTIRANRFVHHMVRIIVGTCYDIVCGKYSDDHFKKLLTSDNRNLAGRTAPAQGLYLKKVYYTEGEGQP
ncbi:MAG: tRNA pseudouridine(38-40) synthase TruA [Candidatus Delongbacteria bacterium]|nr:tRNA pseudouridine(38-40) synthase TruA [Candidatus Delongbacteria bacterium]